MKKCKNCGHVNRDTEPFCEECGAPLINEQLIQVKDTKEKKTIDRSESKNQTEEQPLKKSFLSKKQWGILVLFVCILGGFSLYKLGEKNFSKEQQITNFIQEIQDQDTHSLSKKLTTNEQNFNVTPSSITPLIQYFHSNKTELKKLEQALKKNKKLHGLSIQEKGQNYFFFKRYRFVLAPVYVQVTTNQKAVALTVNQANLGTSDSDTYQQEFGPIAPGNYTFQATVKDSTGENVIAEETRFIDADTYSPVVALNFKNISFPIASNLPDADIYVNDTKVAQIPSGTKTIGPLFWSKGMSIQLKKEINGETIETPKETIKENDFNEQAEENLTLQLNFPVMTEYDVRSALEEFYGEFTKASQKDSPLTSEEFAKKYLADGTKDSAYEELRQLIDGNRKSTQPQASYELTINNFEMIGKDLYQVDYRLESSKPQSTDGKQVPRVEWIDGLTDRMILIKDDFATPTLQFTTIDERILRWLGSR